MLLHEGVDAYKKDGTKFMQRLVAKQKPGSKAHDLPPAAPVQTVGANAEYGEGAFHNPRLLSARASKFPNEPTGS